MPDDFEDKLSELIGEAQEAGTPTEDIITALELARMGLVEEQGE